MAVVGVVVGEWDACEWEGRRGESWLGGSRRRGGCRGGRDVEGTLFVQFGWGRTHLEVGRPLAMKGTV